MLHDQSFDDERVGKGNQYFKVTGTIKHPQRIAYIPAEAVQSQLVVSEDLRRRAAQNDSDAIAAIEAVTRLKEIIQQSLQKRVPTAEVWTNEKGAKVVLYAKSQSARVFWVDGIGNIYYKEGIPDRCFKREPEVVSGLVVLEYEVDDQGEVVFKPAASCLDVGGGHKLDFNYELIPWSINKPKIQKWKEHSRNHPVIKIDYLVWTEKKTKYPETHFSPAGPAVWRRDPMVMRKIIIEAREHYRNLQRSIARDFTVEEIIDLCSGNESKGSSTSFGREAPPQEIDFNDFLGGSQQAQPAVSEDTGLFPAIEHAPSFPDTLTSSPEMADIPATYQEEGIESLLGTP